MSGMGIYSLSEVPDDLLMWSHYAEAHTGICLKFKANIETTIFFENYKVKYQAEYPTINMLKIGSIEQWLKSLAVKSNHWSYEKERRVIKSHEEGGPGIYKFNPELLTGVILGACISKKNEGLVKKWALNHTTPIEISRATLSNEKYELNIS